jgi:S1-C subfamily serine protease
MHAELSMQGDVWIVADRGSSNGTFVNGKRITEPQALLPGDTILIGATTIQFRQGAMADVTAPSGFGPLAGVTAEPRAAWWQPTPGVEAKRGGVPAWVWGAGLAGVLLLGVVICVFGGLGGLLIIGGGEPGQTPTSAVAVATTVSPTPTPSMSSALRTALAAAVLILTPDESGKPVGSGSGSIVTPQGHILTNFHVVGDPDTGKLENSKGLVFIGLTPADTGARPKIEYLAKAIKFDRSLDLALLRIVALKDGGVLPSDLKLPIISVGDSDKVQIGDELTVIGYPGLGEDTVTLTRGSVSGFLEDAESLGRWIKTDSEINPGNSGGMAINKAGELVGIPSRVQWSAKGAPGKLGKIRPINFAAPLVAYAKKDAEQPVNFSFSGWAGAKPTVVPRAGTAAFGKIVICEDVDDDGKPLNPKTAFPAGVKRVTAFWTYSGMGQGQKWGRQWYFNGALSVDKLGQQWDKDESGSISYYLSNDEGLDSGQYEIRLFIDGTEVQRASFVVGGKAAVTPTASCPPLTLSWTEPIYENEGGRVNSEKYPGETRPIYRRFRVKLTIYNGSNQTIPANVFPRFYITDGKTAEWTKTWYYVPTKPVPPAGTLQGADFYALTFTPGQYVAQAVFDFGGCTWTYYPPIR